LKRGPGRCSRLSLSLAVTAAWCSSAPVAEALLAQTQLERPGAAPATLQLQDRYALQSGDTLKFGSLACRVDFASTGGAAQVPPSPA